MKTAIVLFTLFFQAAADPDPTLCCTPSQYSIVYTETDKDDSNHSRSDVFLGVDWDQKLMISQAGSQGHRYILDYHQRKGYEITTGQSCVWIPLPGSLNLPASKCLPSDAVFVGNYPSANTSLHIWNFTNFYGVKFTSIVTPSNCIPYEEHIEKPSTEGPPMRLVRKTSYIQLAIASDKRNIPSDCPQATS